MPPNASKEKGKLLGSFLGIRLGRGMLLGSFTATCSWEKENSGSREGNVNVYSTLVERCEERSSEGTFMCRI